MAEEFELMMVDNGRGGWEEKKIPMRESTKQLLIELGCESRSAGCAYLDGDKSIGSGLCRGCGRTIKQVNTVILQINKKKPWSLAPFMFVHD